MTAGAQRVVAAGRAAPGLPALVFDLSRGKQALLSIAQPGLAAVLALGALPSWRVVGIGLVAAWAGFFAVFSLNDVLDREVDARSLLVGKAQAPEHDIDTTFVRHPLARGDLSLSASLAWVFTLTLVATAGAALLSPLCVLFFAVAVALEMVYCGMRVLTPWKTVVSGVMVGAGGLAGWVAVAPLDWAALRVFLFLALWEIGGRNIVNDLSDIESDARVGIRTVSTVFGPPAAARAAAVVAGLTLVAAALLPMSAPAVLLALACGAWSLGLPALALLRTPTPDQAAAYFNRASLYPDLVLAAAVTALALTEL